MKLRAVALCFLLAPVSLLRAEAPCTRAKDIQDLYNKERWKDVLQATTYCSCRSADLLYYRGMAFARLERWEEAKAALASGEEHYPHDKRFPLELAGIAFKQKRFPAARNDLDRVLHLDPHDRYAINFLATIYFLEGNQEAAIKYWNRIGQPRINEFKTDPQLRVDPALLDRAFTCSPASVLTLEQYRTTLQHLKQLGIFPNYRLDIVPLHGKRSGSFNLVLSAVESDGWGPNKADAAISLLRGLPYESVYPEVYNLRHSAINVVSLFRWDDQKRRVFASVSAPLAGNPQFRYSLYADGRNENWNISKTFHGPRPAVQAFNLEKLELGGGIKSIVNSRWNWTSGLSVSDRRFRNVPAGTSSVEPVFSNGVAVDVHSASNFALLRLPEKRFELNSVAQGSFGNFFAPGFGHFGTLRVRLERIGFRRCVVTILR